MKMKQSNKINMRFEISPYKTIKEQAEKQNIKIKRIDVIDKIKDSLLMCYFHKIITESEFQKGCKRLENLVKVNIEQI